MTATEFNELMNGRKYHELTSKEKFLFFDEYANAVFALHSELWIAMKMIPDDAVFSAKYSHDKNKVENVFKSILDRLAVIQDALCENFSTLEAEVSNKAIEAKLQEITKELKDIKLILNN